MMRRAFVECTVLAAFAALGSGCDRLKEPPPAPFEVMVRVESDPGVPLPGAAIERNGKSITATGADGRAKLTLNGNEGESYDFLVRCPPDFQSPTKPISIILRHVSDNRLPEYPAACPPTVRKVVVAVRAENGPFLPVIFLGKQVGQTDASGAAHVLLAMRPGDSFELALDTSRFERLRPQRPSATFVVKPRDDIQPFDVKFNVEKAKVVYHAGPPRPKRL